MNELLFLISKLVIALYQCPVPPAPPTNPCNSIANDAAIHVAANYDGAGQFTPPSNAGGTYNDPQFNCLVTRLSNGDIQLSPPKSVIHEYANMSALNNNNTLVMLATSSGNWYVADTLGDIVVPTANNNFAGGQGGRWDVDNSYTFYYNFFNTIKKAVIPTNYVACMPNCTTTVTTLHTYSQYTGIGFGGGEGDVNSDHILLTGSCNGTGTGLCAIAGNEEVFVYQPTEDFTGPVFNYQNSCWDNFQLTPDNRAIGLWAGSQPGCVQRYNGVILYDTSWNVIRSLGNSAQHSVLTTYLGHQWYISNDSESTYCNQAGFFVEDIDIGPSSAYCYPLPHGQRGTFFYPQDISVHFGATKDGTGMIGIEVVDYEASGSASYPLNVKWNLPTNPATNVPGGAYGYWGFLSNEIDVMGLSGKFYRIAHHRSRPSGSSYNKIPRASISRNCNQMVGCFVVFDSDYGQGANTPLTNYTDSYMVQFTNLAPF